MFPKREWLESFVVFAELSSFTHAARRLGLSQPALHAQISKLSETLGVPLYRRRGRTLELTREGGEVLRFARQSHERTAAFVERLRGGDGSRPVVLAAGEGALSYLLGPALQAFVRREASALRILTRDRDGTIEALVRGEAQIGVAALADVPDGLRGTLLADVPPVLAMPRTHALAHRRRIGLSDLRSEPLVLPARGRPLREAVQSALADEGVEPVIAAEAGGWAPMLHFVALGIGLAIVNACCRLPRGVVARPISGLPRVRYFALTVNDAPPHDAALALHRALVTHKDAWRA
jgi:DNA-binding transcriptional LysR family regulator